MKFVTPKLASVIVVLCATLLAQTNAAPPTPMAANSMPGGRCAGLKSRDHSAVPTGLASRASADPALKRRAEVIACLAARGQSRP